MDRLHETWKEYARSESCQHLGKPHCWRFTPAKRKRVTWSNTLFQYSGWGDEKEIYNINSPLVESGLIGPVLIKSEITVKTKIINNEGSH